MAFPSLYMYMCSGVKFKITPRTSVGIVLVALVTLKHTDLCKVLSGLLEPSCCVFDYHTTYSYEIIGLISLSRTIQLSLGP